MSALLPIARAALLALALAADPPGGGKLPGPTAGDRCPVCGMFVAKYPDWAATAEFQDGARFHFDGAKDLMKFLLEPGKHASRRTLAELRRAEVTDYYTLARIEARVAFYVVGSDAFGPMGKELVPFARREDAEEFLRDHKGVRVLRFDEVTPALLKELG
jgi:nitrous oxide reductase accessory protein NosL